MFVQRPYLQNNQYLFSFVVVADTHINETEEGGTSPFMTNHQANAKARYVFQEIAAMRPAPSFVIHLGDIVHPVPSLPTFHSAVAHFKEITQPLTMPLHVIPGNHDVGDKHIDWMPADHVCDDYLNTYRSVFGEDYYAFDYGEIRFILLNSLLLNSGLVDEAKQQRWLEQEVAQAKNKRLFIFMHYPPYIYSATERGNYDNIDEPARSWLLEQLRVPAVEAIFAGHVHNFWYDKIGAADFYMLPSTAFLRHDFSEFYKVSPDIEYGRGDKERFGYFVIDAYEQGHIAYSIRTMGEQATAYQTDNIPDSRYLSHPKSSTFDNIGVELRHPWTESMQITATGGVQEFGRKWARNDYPLLALWEMGARLAKVPDIDLLEQESRQRIQLAAELGVQFIVTTLGTPKATLLENDPAPRGIIGYEVNATTNGFSNQQATLQTLRADTGTLIYWSRIRSGEDERFDGKHFTHFVKAGFTLEELEPTTSTYRQLITRAVNDGSLDGITLRLEASSQIATAGRRIAALADELNIQILVSLKLASDSVAQARTDDHETVAMLAQAMLLSKASDKVRYIFDTFMDVDRGYYPRHAFIDRRFNPRPAAHAYTILNAKFSNAIITLVDSDDMSGVLSFTADDMPYTLLFGTKAEVSIQLQSIATQNSTIDLAANHEDYVGATLAQLQTTSESSLQVILVRQ